MNKFSDLYTKLVADYVVSGDEAFLIRIGSMGASAVRRELPLEETADLHHAALAGLVGAGMTPQAASRASTCLSEFLMAYGLAYRDRSQRTLDLQRIDSHRQKLEALGPMDELFV